MMAVKHVHHMVTADEINDIIPWSHLVAPNPYGI